MVEVVFAGDWHGNPPWATSRIQSIGASDVTTILHVGDFGLWPGNSGKRYLQVIEKTCARVGVELLVTPGNHEDWARLTAQWANPKRRDPESGARLPLQLAEHIQILPRGHRFTIGRTNFLSFGGAASVDRHLRTEEVDWWPEEMPSEADVDSADVGVPVVDSLRSVLPVMTGKTTTRNRSTRPAASKNPHKVRLPIVRTPRSPSSFIDRTASTGSCSIKRVFQDAGLEFYPE